MQFTLNEEQSILKDSVGKMIADLAARGGEAQARRTAMAEFGLTQLGLDPEEGLEIEGALVAEAIGAALLPDPYAFAQLGAARVLAGLPGQEALVEAIGEGTALVLPALFEPGHRYALTPARTTLANGTLTGAKSVVLGAQEASHFLVSALDAGETVLALVPAADATLRPFPGLDGRDGADLTFDAVTSAEIVARGAVAEAAIAELYDRVNAALVAEAVGAMGALMEMTTEFLHTRHQFGKPIGVFQVLRHRLVDMNTSYQLARSMATAAALALRDLPPQGRASVISAARLQAAESGRHIGEEAVQLHGAMGMTAEYPAGNYLKRLMALAAVFGDADTHLDRLAAQEAA